MLKLLNDLFSVFFPRLCCACKQPLVGNEKILCTYCYAHLPRTGYHSDFHNPVYQSFWGRAEVEFATSFLFFTQGNAVQKLLHLLKYHGHSEIGTYLGRQFGLELQELPHFREIQMIVPVPLHKKKQRKRGYNQSQMIAEGMAEILPAKVRQDILYRRKYTNTQTRKSRWDRWKNVEDIFEVRRPDDFAGIHFLLVDDVLTTGATLEACVHALKKIPGAKVSVATIAFAYI